MARVVRGRLVFENDLLAKLPPTELERLVPHLQSVELAQEQVLHDSGDRIKHLYFPEDSLVALTASAGKSQSLEIGAAGAGGIVGVPAILRGPQTPFRALVQLPGKAWRVGADILGAEFNRGGKLQDVLLRYLHVLLTQVSQSALCNRFHNIEERFSRWLLAYQYEVRRDELNLTHRTMALMLGVPRTLITMTAGRLQDQGVINYRRGRVTILDGKGLARAACECHRIVRKAAAELLGKS